MQYDVIIVGGGVAGCSAAVTARQRNLTALIIYAGDGALAKAWAVDNYPGLPGIKGPELLTRLRSHAEGMGAEMKHALVRRVMPQGDTFSVLAGNDLYEARAIVLAMGTARVRQLPGEEELLGQGVSYCATCDGMFYKGGTVLVVASDAEAVDEANYLATLAQVLYCKERPHDSAGLNASVILLEGKPQGLAAKGDKIVLKTDKGDTESDGAFVLRPAIAMTQLIPEAAVENGALKLDEKRMTSIPGVYAAGDIAGAPLQAAKAAGDGNVAALSIAGYLIRKSRDNAKPEGNQ